MSSERSEVSGFQMLSEMPEGTPSPKREAVDWNTPVLVGRRQVLMDTFERTHKAFLAVLRKAAESSSKLPVSSDTFSHLMANAYARLWEIPETVCILMPWINREPDAITPVEDEVGFERCSNLFRWCLLLGDNVLTEQGPMTLSQYEAWVNSELRPMLEMDRKNHPKATVEICLAGPVMGREDRLQRCAGWNEETAFGLLKKLIGSEAQPWVLQAPPPGSTLN